MGQITWTTEQQKLADGRFVCRYEIGGTYFHVAISPNVPSEIHQAAQRVGHPVSIGDYPGWTFRMLSERELMAVATAGEWPPEERYVVLNRHQLEGLQSGQTITCWRPYTVGQPCVAAGDVFRVKESAWRYDGTPGSYQDAPWNSPARVIYCDNPDWFEIDRIVRRDSPLRVVRMHQEVPRWESFPDWAVRFRVEVMERELCHSILVTEQVAQAMGYEDETKFGGETAAGNFLKHVGDKTHGHVLRVRLTE